MKKIVIALGLALVFMSAPSAHALSCLPVDMYLDTVKAESDGTFVFVGTATEVTKNHTQVVTVTEAVKGWVAPKLWIMHPYSNDWQYFCSNGPAKAGEKTVFLMTIDPYGSFTVTQTLDADSDMAKDLIKDLKDAKTDAGITEAAPKDRANEMMESIKNLLSALGNMLAEWSYWQGQAR